MADPLSVSASIAGLLTAAQIVSVGIGRVLSSHKSGSREIKDIVTSVDTLRTVLLQLQMLLLSRASVDPKRASLIMVDEVVATLTACVMTFSDLDGCVKGLETDEQLGLLDSVRWVSKASELEGYLRNLEAHKSSLILMTNILTCQSAHNAESAACELKFLMVTVIRSNEQLARRMATMERSVSPSTIGPTDNDSSSVLSQDTVRNATVSASTNPNVHPAFGYSFEEDLQTSWVYMRSKARDESRPFSIGSSVQLTQSWSVLSGLSLSQVSNIAVQALPLFEKDFQNSSLYSFGDNGRTMGHKTLSEADQKPLVSAQKHKSASSGWGSQIRSRLTQSGPNLTLTQKAGNRVETITLPKGLRLLGRSSSSRRKVFAKGDISSPVFISSTYEETSDSRRLPLIPDPPLPKFERNTSLGDSSRSYSGIFRSALHTDDDNAHKNDDGLELATRCGTGYNVLYLAASLFEFHLAPEKSEAGYPYLTYEAGEIFDVIEEKGELWLAKNQDDPTDRVGWLWDKHFARLSRDDSYSEDDGAFTLSPSPRTDKKGKKVAQEDREPRNEISDETMSAEEDSSSSGIPTIVVDDGSTVATNEKTERTDEIVNQSEELRKMYDRFDLRFG